MPRSSQPPASSSTITSAFDSDDKRDAPSSETYARIDQRVADVGQDLAGDEQQGTEIDHGSQGGEVIALDGLDGQRAEAGYAEKGFEQQRPGEQEWDGDDDVGQNRDQGIAQDVRQHDPRLAAALGPGGANIVAIDFLHENGAVEPHVGANAGNDADQHRQCQEAPRQPRLEGKARNREPLQQHADQILPRDDVEQAGNAHRQHASNEHDTIDVGLAKEGDEQRQQHAENQPEGEQRHGQAEARPHAFLQAAGNGRVIVVAVAKIKAEHAPIMFVQQRVGVAAGIGGS